MGYEVIHVTKRANNSLVEALKPLWSDGWTLNCVVTELDGSSTAWLERFTVTKPAIPQILNEGAKTET